MNMFHSICTSQRRKGVWGLAQFRIANLCLTPIVFVVLTGTVFVMVPSSANAQSAAPSVAPPASGIPKPLPADHLYNVLNRATSSRPAADASEFTGTVKIGGATAATTAALEVSGSIRGGKFVVDDQIFADTSNISINIGDIASGDGLRDLALYAGDAQRITISKDDGSITANSRIHLSGTGVNGTMWSIQPGAFANDTFGIVRYESGTAVPSESLVISNNGNVGIGTTNVTSKLTVAGNIETISGGDLKLNAAVGGNPVNIYNDNGEMSFDINGAVRQVITPSGNVGIGTTNPQSLFHVYSSASDMMRVENVGGSEADIRFLTGTGNWEVGTNVQGNGTDKNQFYIYDAGGGNVSQRYAFTVQRGTGNVGIGTTTPGERLGVYSSSTTDARIANFDSANPNGVYATWKTNGTEIGSFGSGKTIVTGGNTDDFAVYANKNLLFGTGTSSPERMRITSAGNVGIGTMSANSKLTVAGDIETISGGDLKLNPASRGNPVFIYNDNGEMDFHINGAVRQVITPSGNVGIGTTGPTKTLHVKGSNDYSQAMIEGGKNAGLHLKPSGAASRPVLTGDSDGGFSVQQWKDDSNFNTTWMRIKDGNVTIPGTLSANALTPSNIELQGLDAVLHSRDIANPARTFDLIGSYQGWWNGEAIIVGGYRKSAKYFSVGGQSEGSRLWVDYGTGNVGIGTTSPQQKLHVAGNAAVLSGGWNAGDITGTLNIGGNYDGSKNTLYYSNAIKSINTASSPSILKARLGFFTLGGKGETVADEVERLSILADNGNVGIGTTNPRSLFHVYSSASDMMRVENVGGSEADINFLTSTGDWQVGTNNAGNGTSGNQFYIYNDNDKSYPLTVQRGTGRVGIGTTAPAQKLHVVGMSQLGDGATQPVFFGTYGSLLSTDTHINHNMYYDGSWKVRNADVPSSSIRLGTGDDANIVFLNTAAKGKQGTEKMRITTDGNVGIGTTSPIGTLDVNGNIVSARKTDGTNAGFYDWYNLSNNRRWHFTMRSGDDDKLQLYFNRGTVNESNYQWDGPFLNVNPDGNVGIGTTDPKAKLHIEGRDTWGGLAIKNADRSYTHFNFPDGKNYIRGTTIIADNSGNVGIGTTSVTSKLTVAGDIETISGGDLKLNTPNNDKPVNIYNDKGEMSFYINGAVRQVITPSGNVGIGTTNPGANLEVRSTVLVSGPQKNNRTASAYEWGATDSRALWHLGFRGDQSQEKGNLTFWYSPDPAKGNNWVTPLSLDENGSVGIGYTWVRRFRLAVNGYTAINGNLAVKSMDWPQTAIEVGDNGWITLRPRPYDAGLVFYESGVRGGNYGEQVGNGARIFYHNAEDKLVIQTMNNNVEKSGITIARATGNVGIGKDPSDKKLDVFGDIKVTSGGSHIAAREKDRIGFDVAELFTAEESVDVGDVLVVGKTDSTVRKSRRQHEDALIGVVSGSPAILFEGDNLLIGSKPYRFQKGTKPPVALAGRVTVKVSTENGFIRTGDYLTSSSMSGVAMKAEKGAPIIGIALESYKGYGVGTALMFININQNNTIDSYHVLESRIKKLEKELSSIKQKQ